MISDLPKENVGDYITALARQHGVTYVPTPTDALADVITRLSDDEVVFDDVEWLLIALERAGVLPSEHVMPLHSNYLNEKFGIEPS